MEIEKQVCSLELAIRLKELGVKQESYAYWYTNAGVGHLLTGQRGMEVKSFSAFTVAELGEMLPTMVPNRRLQVDKLLKNWCVSYICISPPIINELLKYADTEADARAKMLIYLLENSLINI